MTLDRSWFDRVQLNWFEPEPGNIAIHSAKGNACRYLEMPTFALNMPSFWDDLYALSVIEWAKPYSGATLKCPVCGLAHMTFHLRFRGVCFCRYCGSHYNVGAGGITMLRPNKGPVANVFTGIEVPVLDLPPINYCLINMAPGEDNILIRAYTSGDPVRMFRMPFDTLLHTDFADRIIAKCNEAGINPGAPRGDIVCPVCGNAKRTHHKRFMLRWFCLTCGAQYRLSNGKPELIAYIGMK